MSTNFIITSIIKNNHVVLIILSYIWLEFNTSIHYKL